MARSGARQTPASMRFPNRHPWAAWLLAGASFACSDGGGSGAGASGGSSTGGRSTGGVDTGGTSAGGRSTGGTTPGGRASGGVASGGVASGGTASGGVASGGTATGGTSTGGRATVYPPGPPGCGLEEAAFCETFDAPAGATTRAGELDPKRWSAARMCNIGGPTSDDEAVAVGPARVPSCRGDLPEQSSPSDDALICDGNAQIESNHLLMLVAAPELRTELVPHPAAVRLCRSHRQDRVRRRGLQRRPLGLDFAGSHRRSGACPVVHAAAELRERLDPAQRAGDPVFAQLRWRQGRDRGASAFTTTTPNRRCSRTPESASARAAGQLNHFELEVSRSRLDVYATPASEDGVTFGARVLLAGFDVALPFTRGYVHVTAHNHATLQIQRRNGLDAWQARWDNVGFDGPAITDDFREYEALDALEPTTGGKVNLGYRLADSADGPHAAIEIPGRRSRRRAQRSDRSPELGPAFRRRHAARGFRAELPAQRSRLEGAPDSRRASSG